MQQSIETQALLRWQWQMGVDETISDSPINLLKAPLAAPEAAISAPPKQASASTTSPAASTPVTAASASLAETITKAESAAKAAASLDDLREAVAAFEGCPLKKTARNTLFADGNPASDILVIGETPSADEDRQGTPFCGEAGQLFDKMLASIGLSRAEHCYLSNSIFWRPPGGRQPTPEETAICLPFLQRHIELFAPKLIILAGSSAAKPLLNETRGMMRLRGQELLYAGQTPVRALFHPAYLLRQPEQKKLAWQDLLAIEALIATL